MKKNITMLAVTVILAACLIFPSLSVYNHESRAAETPSVETIAESWIHANYPDVMYDELVVEGYNITPTGEQLAHVRFYCDGECVMSTYINAEWYREYAFK